MNLEEILAKYNILLNYYSFGTLLVFIFTSLMSLFFLTLKGKTQSTFHMGIGALLISLFQFGYFLAAIFYHPLAAYHRWMTGGFILPVIAHFGAFLILFPKDHYKTFARIYLIVCYAIIFVVVGLFLYYTSIAPKIFHFTAHHWDFDAYDASRDLAIVIALFSFSSFIVIPIWKMYVVRGRRKLTILAFMIALLIVAVIPNVTNVLSRDGAMERSTYLTSLVLTFVVGLSFITILFINNSLERTTFMLKIVGITLIIILLLTQALVFISMQDKDTEYDSLAIANMNRALENEHRTQDMEYILRLPYQGKTFEKVYEKNSRLDLNIPMVRVDFANSTIYEKIKRLPEKNFRNKLMDILEDTPSSFAGYQLNILHYLDEKSSLSDSQLKSEIFGYFESLNKVAFVSINKLNALEKDGFCESSVKYLEAEDLRYFWLAIKEHYQDCRWNGQVKSAASLKAELFKYFRHFKATETRHYRKSPQDTQHYVAFMSYDPATDTMAEVGYSYRQYRKFIHGTALKETLLLILTILIVLIISPIFFATSLVNPLDDLLSGVEEVNNGDLDVHVKVRVRDEIGFLADSFNKMVSSIKQARKQLQDYAENLEEKVKERTKEVQEKMEEVQRLKVQQDGDYFLTSLLAKPLFYNANKSGRITTDFVISQKKKFEFRGKHADLGGDICVTGNLRLGTPEDFKRYTVAMNGDAMGKSMQGAGGALVMGVVMNSILARSAANNRIMNIDARQWLTELYQEVHSVFKSFNGSMVISATVFVVEEQTGNAWYFNAEHPFTVLYRDGKAQFIEESLQLRKLGLDSEFDFQVFEQKLLPGDVLIMGSDGRDDLDLTPDEPVRTINEDENLFLQHVEEGRGDLEAIEARIVSAGELTDDLSLLRLEFLETAVEVSEEDLMPDQERVPKNTEEIYERAKELYKSGNRKESIELLEDAFSFDQENQKVNRLLGLLSFKGKDYKTAVNVLGAYLSQDPEVHEYRFYLSVAKKKLGRYEESLDAALELEKAEPENVANLVNIADLYRLMDDKDRAREFLDRALQLDPNNQNATKLERILQKDVNQD